MLGDSLYFILFACFRSEKSDTVHDDFSRIILKVLVLLSSPTLPVWCFLHRLARRADWCSGPQFHSAALPGRISSCSRTCCSSTIWASAGNGSLCSALKVCCWLEGHSKQKLQQVGIWFMGHYFKITEAVGQNKNCRCFLYFKTVKFQLIQRL